MYAVGAETADAVSPRVVSVVTGSEAIASLRDEWNELLLASQHPSVFLSFEWMTTWWQTQRHEGESCVLLLRNERDGAVEGLAPLYRTAPRSPGSLRSITFMGAGVGADHLAFLSRPGLEPEVYEGIVRFLLADPTWDVLDLPRMDARHAAFAADAIARSGSGALTCTMVPADLCPFVSLPPTWDAYLKVIGRNARKNLGRLWRRLEGQGGVAIQRVRSTAEIDQFWGVFLDLHQIRRQSVGDTSAFTTVRSEAFHAKFIRAALERGWLRFYVLQVDGHPLAAQYCLSFGGRTAAVQTGFDVQWAPYGVGMILMAHAIRTAIEEGDTEFDFLRGAEPYKQQRWAAMPRTDISLVAWRRHPRVRFLMAVREQGRAVKEQVRGRLKQSRTALDKAIRLVSAPGARWRGEERGPMQPPVATTRRAEASRQAQRDHRRIGRELNLFRIVPEVGPGLPLWMPRGATIRRIVERYIVDLELASGYQHVCSQEIASSALYKLSGHWDHYREHMYPPMRIDNDELVLRPMNCPHHIVIYKHGQHSYRDLPVRIAELGKVYRYEPSGSLTGLTRVRGMTMNDAHIFCRPDQIQDEIAAVVRLIQRVYADFKITSAWYRLSLRDPANRAKFVQNDALWEQAERMLREALSDLGIPFAMAIGEAAFYGPKIDVQVPTAAGKDETISTVQLDFVLPERFGLEYVDEDGQPRRPVMIHRAVTSTMERWMALLIEQVEGRLPLWLAPEQVCVLPIADRHAAYARQTRDRLAGAGLRVEVDASSRRLGCKIRRAYGRRVPYMAVVGDREVTAGTVAVRSRPAGDQGPIPVELLIERLQGEAAEKR